MSSEKLHATITDYLIIALSPLLIMALVGSLVFFLVEILYIGEYGERMRWILFCFVFGSVLVSRISMLSEIADRAGLYGFVLGGLTWLALQQYVKYDDGGSLAGLGPIINLFLVAITWWSAHRLTWDCTFIDDNIDASGEGLMQTAGLDGAPSEPEAEDDGDEDDEDEDAVRPRKKKSRKRKAEAPTGLLGWWDRYRRYRDERARRPHNPGVWVVYFSLAALPLFGLGQSLIPAADSARRQQAFWLMVIYVGSGLGLLLTTAFLGLRRYLRQRKLEMPLTISGLWLATGGGLILALLLVGTLLPRPYAEYTLLDAVKRPTGRDRSASNYNVKDGDTGKDQGRPSSQKTSDDKGTPGSKTRPGKDGKGDGQKKAADGQKKSDSADKSQSSERQEKSNTKDSSQQKSDRDGNRAKDKAGDKQDKSDSSRSSGNRSSSPQRMNLIPHMPPGLTSFVRGIVYVALALAGLWFLVTFLANFTHWAKWLVDWLRDLWQSLFGGWTGRTETEEAEPEAEPARSAPRPFASFRNPFLGGGRPPEEIVRYCFEALEAFAAECELARGQEETPLEFADRLGRAIPALEADVHRLAALYARAAYARGRLPAESVETLRLFWEKLESTYQRLSVSSS